MQTQSKIDPARKSGLFRLGIGQKLTLAMRALLAPERGRSMQTRPSSCDGASAILAALHRSQAIIEFTMDGTILTANQNYLDALGFTLAEIEGRHHRIFFASGEDSAPDYRAFWDRLRQGQFEAAEHRHITRDGREIWIQASYTPVSGPDGQPRKVVKLATDITASKLLTIEHTSKVKAMNRSQAMVEFALDGTILDANAHFCRSFGYGIEEIRGRPHSMFVDPVERTSEEYNQFWSALRRGEYQQGEYRRIGKDGRDVWLQANYNPILDPFGRTLKIVKFATDTTHAKIRAADDQGKIEAIGKSQAIIEFAMDGTILTANGKFLTVFGYGLDDIVGRHHSLFVPVEEQDTEAYRAFWADLRNGDYRAATYRRIGKGGRTVWIYACYNPILGLDGEPVKVVKFAADITDEVARREQVNMLSLVADTTSNSVVITDADGRIEYVNAGFSRMTGYNFEEVRDRKPGDLLQGPATSEVTRERIRQKLANRLPFCDEILNYTRGGDPYWIALFINPVKDEHGRVNRFVSIQTDVTERRNSESRYRILADTTSDVILQLNLELQCTYVSPACLWVLGSMPEEMIGTRPLASMHPDDIDPVSALATQLVAGEIEGGRTVATYRARHKLGHWVWLEAGMNLVRDGATGAPTSMICCLRDVTERQRIARDLERARAAAEEATTAKAVFVANMSHELRTPLTGMLGVHDLLRRDPHLSDAQKRLVGLASVSGRSLLNIVNDILDLSKIEAGQLTLESVPFDLRSLVDTCQALASEGMKGKPVAIAASFDLNEPGWFLGDPSRLQQILLNLMTNAAKFTEQGMIAIGVSYAPMTSLLRVDVQDTGIGIPAEKLPLLFERFSQTDASVTRRFGGTGLGLAISKHLVELMQGRIGVESREGEGSRFWFELPLQQHTEVLNERASVDDTHRRGCRILLAEDNGINQEIIGAMLRNQGHRVDMVSDGSAALKALQTGKVFDLVLMDLQMPVMDGMTATSVIRRLEQAEGGRRLPIIGLTANAMSEDVVRCLDAGMDGHVAKPIDWPVLFAAIERVISTSEAHPLRADRYQAGT